MITRLGTAPRAENLDYGSFQEHWQHGHADVAREIEGVRSYLQNHALLDGGLPLLPYVGFDACSQLEFDDLDAMDRAFASEHYRSTVRADERNLIDGSRFRLALMHRRTLREVDGGAATAKREVDGGAATAKLMTFWQRDPEATLAELDAALAGPGRADAGSHGCVGHEQLIEISGAHEGRPPAVCSALDVLWFPTATEALAFLGSAEAHRTGWEMSGIGRGAVRLLAREVTIVAAG